MNHAIQLQKEIENTKGLLKSQGELKQNYEILDGESRQMNKENRSLKNERATLQVTIRSREDYIKDLEGGRSFLFEIISDLNTSISRHKTQNC